MRGLLVWVLILGALLLSQRASAAEPGSELTLSLLTMGPGEHPFTKFGHTAIWVHDEQAQRDEVYNYGTFAFDSKTALLDSVAGKLPYWLSVQSFSGTLRTYRAQGRSLQASELELAPAQRLALHAALRENALPANRYYRYDYYRDNCATRVRDVIDQALGGQLRAQTIGRPASMSYRAHTQRLVADDRPLYAGLDIAVGRQTDTAVTFWDEGWLPQRLYDAMKQAHVMQGERTLPLIRSEQTLASSRFAQPAAQPPNWLAQYVAAGLAVAGVLLTLGQWSRRSRGARVALGLAYALLGALFGLLGCALCYLTFFSAHSAAASNYNVLLVPPWLLALCVAGVGIARGKPSAWQSARYAATGAGLTTVLALLIYVLTRSHQANFQETAFFLIVWGSVAGSARNAAEGQAQSNA